ncbi:hypothetical protein LZD49_30675 [Dyadobacter sp. CY261]|uniref:hypothetical protein n=1 Tax=Dyadobacter sp. CY261 TaxID=2907203 RepID=UPI001F3DC362|nr:hypothetical protein [Dyadobacter sp. CY261]MCF0074890.1 hypothetical protein [Dyadobacter sp. CY261]
MVIDVIITSEVTWYKLSSVNGQINLDTQKLNAETTEVDLSNASPGLYVLRLLFENEKTGIENWWLSKKSLTRNTNMRTRKQKLELVWLVISLLAILVAIAGIFML